MDVVGHYDEFVQINGGETLGKRFPRVIDDLSHLGHLKIWLASLQAYGHEIGSWFAVIIAFETDGTPVMLFWIIAHRYVAPLQDIYKDIYR